MKSDNQIQKDVMEELKWEPFLNAAEIGVAVKNGIVTLSGQVDSYSKKIAGEKAIAEDMQIGVSPLYKKSDTEIAAAVLNALRWHTDIQEDKLKVKVEDGNVTLEGDVDWEFERYNAKKAIENLLGVRSVINLISVKPKTTANDIEKKISSAFHRNATIDAERITAEVVGNTVILRGKVRSFVEKDDAENAAWAAPGILRIDNKLIIEEPEFAF